MFANDGNEKIFQTLPGQRWRVLIQWNPDDVDAAEGFPATTLEPVIAWVTAKVERNGSAPYDEVIITPLVRFPSGDELILLDSREFAPPKFVYLVPGEELLEEHFARLRGEKRYAKAVTLG